MYRHKEKKNENHKSIWKEFVCVCVVCFHVCLSWKGRITEATMKNRILVNRHQSWSQFKLIARGWLSLLYCMKFPCKKWIKNVILYKKILTKKRQNKWWPRLGLHQGLMISQNTCILWYPSIVIHLKEEIRKHPLHNLWQHQSCRHST